MDYLKAARRWKALPDEKLAAVLAMIDHEATVLLGLLDAEDEPTLQDVIAAHGPAIDDLFDQWPLQQIPEDDRTVVRGQIASVIRDAVACQLI